MTKCIRYSAITSVFFLHSLINCYFIQRTSFDVFTCFLRREKNSFHLRKGLKLTGSVILSTNRLSSRTCAQKCGKTRECRSFNFCSPFLCELSSDDVFSIGPNQFLLEDNPDCSYMGMNLEEMPACIENDNVSLKDIQDDNSPGNCQINQKRVDKEWSEWEKEFIDTSEEYKDIDTRHLLSDFAHGGKKGSNETLRVYHWLKLVHITKVWSLAKDDCERIGCKLFSDVDGTPEQLNFLAKRFGYWSQWLGIYRTEASSTQWITTDGKSVGDELLYWDTGTNVEPDMGNNLYVAIYCNNNRQLRYLHDATSSMKYRSICDMRNSLVVD